MMPAFLPRFSGRLVPALLLASLLTACGPADSESPASPGSTAASQPAAASAPDPARYKNQPLQVVDVSEQQLEGAATLVVTFSMPLQEKQTFADHARVTLRGDRDLHIKQAWELSADQTELRMRHLPPKATLTVSIDKELAGITGNRLGQDYSASLETSDLTPMVGFASRGSLLPAELADGLPVLSLNVSEVDVDFYRVHERNLHRFIRWQDGSNSLTPWENDTLQKRASLVYSARFDLNSEANVQQRTLLPIRDLQPLQEPGIYFAVMRQAGDHGYYQAATLFSQSDIGLSVHSPARGHYEVFALSLSNGRPLADVEVSLYNEKDEQTARSNTDKTGHTRLDGDTRLIVARKGKQTSFLRLQGSALNLSEFEHIQGEKQQAIQLFAFSPRDLYRPGETLQFNALLRDRDGRLLDGGNNAERPLEVEISTPEGKPYDSFVWTPSHPGFYQHSFKLPDSAPTGRWQILIRSGDLLETLHELQVEDFMPERMALELSGSEQPLAPQDPVMVEVNGRFLYGAPAAGSQVQGQLFVRPLRQAVPALPGYVFGSVTENLPSENLDFREQITDEQGRTRLQLDSEWDSARSPLELIARISLMESGGRPVTRRLVQPVWPAPQLPGILPGFDQGQVNQDSLAAFQIVLANAAGEQLASDNLQVRLVRERRDYYWSYSSSGGWSSTYNEKTYTVQQQSLSVTPGQPARVEFPVQWGSYRLEVEDPATGLVSSERFWAGYRWQDSSQDGGGVRPDQVRLQLDQPAYHNGDTAVVRVEAPHAGSGYLMLESSEGLHWWQTIEVPDSGLDVRVPVGDYRGHDLYLSALVVRPGQRNAEHTAKRAVGLLHLPLDREQRKLQVTLDTPQKMRPEQPLPIRVQVLDASGKPAKNARTLVSAVDSGVLNITEFKTPDPWQAFFGRKAYAHDQYDVYSQLIDASNAVAARLRFGGDAALEQGGGRPKAHVRIVSWQSAVLETDDNGWASVEMPMPDFNGEVRVMAQAWTDDSFAHQDSPVTVAAPLIAEMSLPRFLANGDHSRLALDLHNLTEQRQQLQLSLANDPRVQLRQLLPEQVELAAGQRLVLPLEVSAMDVGTAELALQISGVQADGETLPALQRSWKLDVRSPWPAQSRRLTHVLEPGERWTLPRDWLDGLLPGSLHGRLTLSSQPVAAIETFVSNLYDYPYGCAEQTSSRMLPLLYLNPGQLSAMTGKPVSAEEREQLLQSVLHHVLAKQRHDGSIGMWSPDSEEDYWDSVYVADVLQRARSQGMHVPPAAYDRLLERLQRYTREGRLISASGSENMAHTRFAVQAYAALVLAREDKISLGTLRSLHGKAADARTPLPLIHLAVALHQAGDSNRAQELLKKAPLLTREKYFWVGDYGSRITDQGWQLLLLQESGLLDAATRSTLLGRLIDEAHDQRWYSTQENAALFMALHSTGLLEGDAWQASVSLAGNSSSLSPQQPSVTLGARALAGPLELHNTSEIPLFQVVSARGETPNHQPQPGKVLQISREYYQLDGSPARLDVDSGTLLLVHLTVSAEESVQDALVVDMLPAGFELENQNLGNSSVLLDEIERFRELGKKMQDADIAMQSWMDDRYVAAVSVESYRPTHLLYLVRAVTPGEYRLPPAQVESMYRPDWQAEYLRQDEQSLIIRSR